ncbi:hypothetical protein [Polyangium jinanense]|uniref:DUF3558 domain-containing protein n=1 Tax=Polyangium jinanense TaxID=2829994 RepID=A0A9X3X4A6_9BACT|nr:hypothetical protein [Polyangium jinanense]MDC3954096.1 hypothetical protein [Polyangium jinanense]MDC3981948.1 hypothetical protein [Polyangium jinanense]
MPSLIRRVGPSALLVSFVLAAGCRDEPSPTPEGRASQVPANEKPAPTSVSSARPKATAPPRPTLVAPPPASASAAPAPSASAAVVEPPALPPDPPLDCDVILTPEEIKDACGIVVEADSKQPTEDIGPERTCSRRWNSKDAGTLSLLVVRHGSDAEAKERYKDIEGEVSGIEAISGLGDIARRYVKKGAGGHPIFNVEVVKGRFDVQVFNPKITLGDTTVGPVCDHAGLEKLLAKAVTRLP